ncbi:MAG: hypothetical protein R3185_01230 [Candidatus Thermoplasmatota archaeon]|nr:hypothetical protein [Candidatus Thermoplasmatota archaeon]
MEQLLVFKVRATPDRPLALVEEALAADGFRWSHGERYDRVGKRTLDRVYLGLGPHPQGLAARVKTKSLVPGRSTKLMDRVEGVLHEALGPAWRRVSRPQEEVPAWP